MHTGTHFVIDRQFDRWQVGGQDGNAIAIIKLRQAGCESGRVLHVKPLRYFGDVLMAKVSRRLGNLPLHLVKERRVRFGQNVGEPKIFPQARPAPRHGGFTQCRDGQGDLLRGLGIDARSTIHHTIHRSRSHARLAGDVGDGGGSRHRLI